MILSNANRIVLDGREATRATLNGQVVWTAEQPPLTHATNFSEYPVGQAPHDWTLRIAQSANWQVVESEGSKVLRLVSTPSARNLLTWDVLDSGEGQQDAEVLLRYRFTNTDINSEISAMVRASGSAPNTLQGYEAGAHRAQAEIRVTRFLSGAATRLGTFSETHSVGPWYWIRFRVEGSLLQIKAWPDGADEPDSWLNGETDESISTSGWIGLRTFGGSGVDVGYFSVGLDGAKAPLEIGDVPTGTLYT